MEQVAFFYEIVCYLSIFKGVDYIIDNSFNASSETNDSEGIVHRKNFVGILIFPLGSGDISERWVIILVYFFQFDHSNGNKFVGSTWCLGYWVKCIFESK